MLFLEAVCVYPLETDCLVESQSKERSPYIPLIVTARRVELAIQPQQHRASPADDHSKSPCLSRRTVPTLSCSNNVIAFSLNWERAAPAPSIRQRIPS